MKRNVLNFTEPKFVKKLDFRKLCHFSFIVKYQRQRRNRVVTDFNVFK